MKKVVPMIHRKYSNRTLDVLAHFVEGCFTHSEIDSLFFASSVPEDADGGSNKLQRVLNVLRFLSQLDEPDAKECLDNLLHEVVRRRRRLLIDFGSVSGPDEGDNAATSLRRSLKSDGFSIREGTVVPIDPLEADCAEEVDILSQRLTTYHMEDVKKNLDQAHQNFVSGNFESCNAMLRTAVEGTLKHLACHMAGSEDKIPRNNPKHLFPADIR